MVYIDGLLGETVDEARVPKYYAGAIKKSITEYKNKFLSEHLGVDIKVGDGPASKELIHNMKLSLGHDSGQISIEFRGVKVADVYADKTLHYSIGRTVNEFKKKKLKRNMLEE